MRYKIELHSDKRGLLINKRLDDDFSQIIFTIRPWVIWTRRHHWGKARPAKKERKETEGRVLAETLTQTGPWYVGDKRIPDDVQKRAEKGGATGPPDWYCGR